MYQRYRSFGSFCESNSAHQYVLYYTHIIRGSEEFVVCNMLIMRPESDSNIIAFTLTYYTQREI